MYIMTTKTKSVPLDEESLEDHNIQGLGAYRDVFDADGEQ